MIATDYVGLGALISAVGSTVIGIIVAFRQTTTNRKVDDVHHEVKTANGNTAAEIIEAGEDRRTAAGGAPISPHQ